MDQDQLKNLRHTLAHVLAAAVHELYPHAKSTIGPAVDTGFYYDFDFAEGAKPGDSDLKKIEQKMREMLKKWDAIEGETVNESEVRQRFAANPYKLELIDDIVARNEPVTLYHSRTQADSTSTAFTDLCRGGHTEHPNMDIPSTCFSLDRIAGAYWRGDENNPMLTRIYGLAFENKEALERHKSAREEALKRDHRKLGSELDLFTFSDLVGAGLPLWMPKGTLLRELIIERIMAIQEQYGYEKVTIPHITKKDLYETSGHWQKFGDELFKVSGASKQTFVMKPMNCPHHTQIYAARSRSYRELPLRFAETTMVYRDEQAGELLGLSRVRSITQDDGHVFCMPDQIEREVRAIIDVIRQFYSSLDLFHEGSYWASISVRDPATPDTYLGDADSWDRAEAILESIAESEHLPYKVVPGEAAFYGPKIDFMFKDALNREWQLATAQLDFVMPSRFGLQYVAPDGSKQTPVMLHRAIAGSLERFLSVLIEHFAGAFPLWLSPVQLQLVPISESHHAYTHTVYSELKNARIRVEILDSNDSLGKRIRQAKVQKTPYFCVIGDKEVAGNTVSLESRDRGQVGSVSIRDVIMRLSEERALSTNDARRS